MPRWAKRLLIGIGAFALLLGGAYLALVKSFPPQRIAALVSGEVSQRTGRDFRIHGALDYRVLPHIAVVAEDLTLANAAWATRADMLRVQRAALQLELWPLLQGQVKIGSVALDGVDLLLETDAKGQGNWDMPGLAGEAAPAAPDQEATRSVDLDKLHLGDVRLAYRDGVNGQQLGLALQQLELQRNRRGHQLEAEWSIQEQRWRLDGQLGPLEQLLANQAAWPFTLKLRSAGARVDVAAQLLPGPAPRTGSLDIEATLDEVAALAAWVEQPSRVPLPIELKSTLKLSAGLMQADALRLSMAGQVLTGSATLRNGKPWQLEARLNAATLDLKRLLPASGASASGRAANRTKLFDDTPIPFGALPKGMAKLELQVDKLLLPDATPLSALRASLDLRPSGLKIEPFSFGLSEGQLRGSVALSTGAAAVPLLRLQVDGAGLSAEALARLVGLGHQISGGRVQLKAGLSLSGNTPRAMAAGANGDVLLSMKGVTLGDGNAPIGPNLLPRLLSAITLQRDVAKSTTLECAVLRLPFRNGVAQVDRSIAIETPDLAISAAGHVDLRDETLELAFRPTPKAALGLNTAQLASLVVAKGAILDPKLTFDAKGAAGMALSIGAAVASGGLSMLAQNVLKHASDPHPCQFAATGVAAKAPPSPSGKAAEPASAEPDLPGLLRKIFK